ncbi:lysophospholipid acyltransferase family protein [Ferriphaselus sp. R-1]|uniref:lysophospholipid acyltransferase family protein n=1 Tax=Ferriphaselus sp. R-1 TaxID=1485544 RepID=UPI000B2BD37B|nr:lysophospholipid acyltransferase family protein [Ferriphaselus sp. R-1]
MLYGGLLFFALICLAWSLPAGVFRHLLPQKRGARIGQYVIMLVFRLYLAVVRASGLVKLDLRALDALRGEPLIITTNHPALIDVVLIGSRLPRIVCVLKAALLDNPLLGGGASMAGYIRNDSTGNLIRRSAEATRGGSQLLIFPEGTRTVTEPINPFKGGFGLVALKAGVPVQTVFIETNSPFLGKHWPLLKKPEFPLVYRVTLGKRFEVKGDVKTFVADLEDYYRSELLARKHK